MRGYFNAVYNPLYDRTTARLTRYVEAQRLLSQQLQLEPGLRILCVGLGTGNELASIRAAAGGVEIVGVDYSATALSRARRKPAGEGAGTVLLIMEAQRLGFRDNSFDRVLAYHLTDFLPSPEMGAREMLRVLKPGGRFVISFPSRGEGIGLGIDLFRQGFTSKTHARSGTSVEGTGVAILAGLVYLPLLLRPRPNSCSLAEIEEMLVRLGGSVCDIEHDPVYRDHIVSGIKYSGGQ
ncbi:class I SAM-dependent methyltransferase [Chloroflexota bacterium]